MHHSTGLANPNRVHFVSDTVLREKAIENFLAGGKRNVALGNPV
jgi:hypothetical protein